MEYLARLLWTTIGTVKRTFIEGFNETGCTDVFLTNSHQNLSCSFVVHLQLFISILCILFSLSHSFSQWWQFWHHHIITCLLLFFALTQIPNILHLFIQIFDFYFFILFIQCLHGIFPLINPLIFLFHFGSLLDLVVYLLLHVFDFVFFLL